MDDEALAEGVPVAKADFGTELRHAPNAIVIRLGQYYVVRHPTPSEGLATRFCGHGRSNRYDTPPNLSTIVPSLRDVAQTASGW